MRKYSLSLMLLTSKMICLTVVAAEDTVTNELEPITVIGRATDLDSYAVPDATTATKTDTPIMETPASINIVTEQSLRDRQVFTVGEAFRYTSGVIGEAAAGRGPFQEAQIIRGFLNGIEGGAGGFFFRDGFRAEGIPISISNLDRLELLKGPATVLYGQSEPGGLVNAVYKKPQAAPYYSLEQRVGSYDFYQTNVDATGPITQDDTLLYRFNLSYIDRDSFKDFIESGLVSVAPSVTWNISDRAHLTAQYEFNRTEWNFDTGIPAIGNRPARIPANRFVGIDPAREAGWHTESHLADLKFSYQVNDAWKLNWVGLYTNQETAGTNSIVISNLDEATGQVTRGAQVAETGNGRDQWFTMFNLTGELSILNMKHKLLAGFDYNRDDDDDFGGFFRGDIPVDFNIFDPVHDQGVRLSLSEIKASGDVLSFNIFNERWGIYLQDQIQIGDHLHLVLGGRFDDVDDLFTTRGSGAEPANKTDLTPRYGVVYQPWPWLSTYYQYVESFGRFSSGRSADGSTFNLPQTGEQHEAGVKAEFFDGRLISTLAFYHLTKENVTAPDPGAPAGSGFTVPIGKARSQGIELDVTGQITDRLNLMASYSFTDARIKKGSDEGNRLLNVPEHFGSLWSTYDVTPSFRVGAGVIALGQRQGDNANSFQLPGFARVDAMAAYRFSIKGSGLTTQVNINNLLDKEYFAFSGGGRIGNGGRPGEPLTVFGSLRLEY